MGIEGRPCEDREKRATKAKGETSREQTALLTSST